MQTIPVYKIGHLLLSTNLSVEVPSVLVCNFHEVIQAMFNILHLEPQVPNPLLLLKVFFKDKYVILRNLSHVAVLAFRVEGEIEIPEQVRSENNLFFILLQE